MSKKRKAEDIETIAERAHGGADVSGYFSGKPTAKQEVAIDFPLAMLKLIDVECELIGVTRQAWIKLACDERLRQIQTSRQLAKAS